MPKAKPPKPSAVILLLKAVGGKRVPVIRARSFPLRFATEGGRVYTIARTKTGGLIMTAE